MASFRMSRRGRPLALERLEGRTVLAADAGPSLDMDPVAAGGVPPDCAPFLVTGAPRAEAAVAPVFSAGFPECDAALPWIAAASEGARGAVVFWLKLDVRGGVTTAHVVPIWSRPNPAPSPAEAAPDPSPVDLDAAVASIDGFVFGRAGGPLGDAPLTFADLADFVPPLEDGVQEYFIVARSDSDFALVTLASALMLVDMPGANAASTDPGGASTDAGAVVDATLGGQPAPVEAPPPAPIAWLQRLRAERPFGPASDPAAAFPAGLDGPAWLVDAQRGDSGVLVLWVAATSSGGLSNVLVLPVWVKFNPDGGDAAFAWTDGADSTGTSSTTVYPGDGGPVSGTGSVTVGAGDAFTPAGDGVTTAFVVSRSDSNLEILMSVVFLAIVQAPGWSVPADTAAGLPGASTPLAAGGSDGNGPSFLSAWLRDLGGSAVPPPGVSLVRDTGLSDTDGITRDGRLHVETATGCRAEYSIDGGRTWRRSFRARPGVNVVQVRQVDRSGAASAPTEFDFTLDRRRPVAPGVGLAKGRDGERSVVGTLEGSLVAWRVEPDARLEYSVNGRAWTTSLAPADRTRRVRVRQVDVAGNASTASLPVTVWRVIAAGEATSAAAPVLSLRPRWRRV